MRPFFLNSAVAAILRAVIRCRVHPELFSWEGARNVRAFIIRKSKCSTDFKRNDFLKKNEAYPLGALRSLKFAYRKLRISLFVELAV